MRSIHVIVRAWTIPKYLPDTDGVLILLAISSTLALFFRKMIRTARIFQRVLNQRNLSSQKHPLIGIVGLGHMGSKIAINLATDLDNLIVFDPNVDNQTRVTSANSSIKGATSVKEVGEKADIIFTMLPNDEVVHIVSQQLLSSSKSRSTPFLHVSCSTTSPNASRALQQIHIDQGNNKFVAAPVFARPDGLARREAIFMVSGETGSRQLASFYLSKLGRIEDMGDEIGAANVVKLCGNFLIAVRCGVFLLLVEFDLAFF